MELTDVIALITLVLAAIKLGFDIGSRKRK